MGDVDMAIAPPGGTTNNVKKPAKKKPLGRAVQIVSLSDKKRENREARDLKLDSQVLWDIMAKAEPHPITVIAIAGPARCGKSLTSNYLVKYLYALENSENGDAGDWMCKATPDKKLDDTGFLFRSGMDRTTEGIWMWSRPFIIKRSQSDSPMAVLVMDTEGCFDPYSSDQEQSSIIGLSLLLSSCFIYNDLGRINEKTYTTLAGFMQYGQLASQSFDDKVFQRLMFLIRDWTYSEFEHGASGGQGFIRKCLAADSKMSAEAVKSRKLIKDNFVDYNAYLMPYPGSGVVSDEFTGSIGEMSEDFRNHLEKFIKHLIADVEPKRFGNEVAYAEPFRELFCKFSDAFNDDNMPSPASILAVTVLTVMNTQIQKLTGEYEASVLKKLASKNLPFHAPEILNKYNRKYREAAFEKFQHHCRPGSTDLHQTFAENLELSLVKKFNEICRWNTEEQKKFIQSRQESCRTKFQAFIQGRILTGTKIWSKADYDNALSQTKQDILEEFKSLLINTPKAFAQDQVALFTTEIEAIQQSVWSVLREKTTKAESEAEEIVMEVCSSYADSLELIQGVDVLRLSRLQTAHDKFMGKYVLEGKKRLNKIFQDPDFIQRYVTDLENSILNEYQKLHLHVQGIEDIISTVVDDLNDIVEVFKEEVRSQFAENPSLDESTIQNKFEEILKLGEDTVRDRGLPDPALTTKYVNDLNTIMRSALSEMQTLICESKEYKRAECEKAFHNVSESFLQTLALPPHELMEVQEIHSWIGQIVQNIRPNYESTLRNINSDEIAEFSKKFDELVKDKIQLMVASHSEKMKILESLVDQKTFDLIQCYTAEMKKQQANWTKQEEITSSHQYQLSHVVSRLKSDTTLSQFPRFAGKYEKILIDKIQKSFDVIHEQISSQLEQRKRFIQQIMPDWIAKCKQNMQKYIRGNSMDEDSEVETHINGKLQELESGIKNYVSQTPALGFDFEGDAVKIFRNETISLKPELLQCRAEVVQSTKKILEDITNSCMKFAETHNSMKSLDPDGGLTADGFDGLQQQLRADVKKHFDDQWKFPSDQKKLVTLEKILTEINLKFQTRLDECLERVQEEADAMNVIAENILTNFCAEVETSHDTYKFYDPECLKRMLSAAQNKAKGQFQMELTKRGINEVDKMPEFVNRLEDRVENVVATNHSYMEVASIELEEIWNQLISQRETSIRTQHDLDKFLTEVETKMMEYLKPKSVDELKPNSPIVLRMQEFRKQKYKETLEQFETTVSDHQAAKILQDSVKIYNETMQKYLENQAVNPESLREFHGYSLTGTIIKLSKSCFISRCLQASIRERLAKSLEIFQEQNSLKYAQGGNLAVGIDLGTTTSCVAIYRNGEAVVIKDDNNRSLIPSYVHFDDSGSPITGYEAKNQASFYPETTIFDAKRLIGRDFNDKYIQEDIKTWPFQVKPDSSGRPVIAVRDMEFSPEGISAKVLMHMRKLASRHLNQKIVKAVITVPANFTDRQRDATRQAAMIAGLEVLQIINEPTAAAMAYALNWKNEEKTVLVFDFGGGTFDVTILKTEVGPPVSDNDDSSDDDATSSGASGLAEASSSGTKSSGSRLRVLHTDGHTHLGGEDFDSNMVNFCVDKFHQQHGVHLLEIGTGNAARTARNRILRRLRNTCEEAKAILTTAATTTVEVDGIQDSLDLSVTISRQEFEKMNDPLFREAIDIVRGAVASANLQPRDITDVLMVGGSSRVPRVRQLLQDFLGIPSLNINQRVDIQEAVAIGASIQACILNGGEGVRRLPLIKDIQPFSLGILLDTGKMSVIIKRSTLIPCEAVERYFTASKNQKMVEISIYAGEDSIAGNNALLGSFQLSGIPLGPARSQEIRVKMQIDRSGILNVTATSTSTNQSQNLIIKECRGRFTEEEIASMRSNED